MADSSQPTVDSKTENKLEKTMKPRKTHCRFLVVPTRLGLSAMTAV
jgi:hypothetical protein